MTRVFDEESGRQVPVTVLQLGPCFVSQVKTSETDGYDAVQIAFEDVMPRRSTMPIIGHDAKAGVSAKRFHREFRVKAGEAEQFELGQELTIEALADIAYVDVVATSKGKGTAGPMKRHGFKGMSASHGTERKHRGPGSIGGRSSNRGTGKPKKGGKKAGQMGNGRVTMRSLKVISRDTDKNLLLVKGPVPGANSGVVFVREAIRLYGEPAK
jgi:large subunit ribosomal protein L3